MKTPEGKKELMCLRFHRHCMRKHKLLRSTTSLPSHSVSRLHSSGVKIFNTAAGRRTQRSGNREESGSFSGPSA